MYDLIQFHNLFSSYSVSDFSISILVGMVSMLFVTILSYMISNYVFDKKLKTHTQLQMQTTNSKQVVDEAKETEETCEAEETEETEEDEYDEEVESSNLEKALHLVGELDECEIETLLEECTRRVLIPNWYTKTDLEKLAETKISDEQWDQILDSKVNELIGQSNAMCLQWFESEFNNEDDDSNDSDYVDEEENASLESEELIEKENTKNKEHWLIQDDDSDDSEVKSSTIYLNRRHKMRNKLLMLPFNKLKKLAKIKNNNYSKSQLVSNIMKKPAKSTFSV